VVVEVATAADEDDSLLHPAELALMGAMVPGRKGEFAAGRNAARRALGRLGFPDATLPRRPGSSDVHWPEGIMGSISHTRGLRAVACVRTSQLRSVGLDVEEAGPLGDEIIDAICRPEELAALAQSAAPLPSDWPRLVFAMKEAAYKALYPVTRRVLTFHDVRVDVNASQRSYRAEMPDRPAPELQVAGRFHWDDTWVAAGAVIS
jgi:4'-phosphopantetheinyl transferase EntD